MSVMIRKVRITEKATGKVVWFGMAHKDGQNYEPGEEETFAFAWKLAGKDGRVDPERRDAYRFELVPAPLKAAS
jgi:hypothetical protein